MRDTKLYLATAVYHKRASAGTLRKPLGLRAVAAKIGVSAATISRIERGGKIDTDTLIKVCVWLGKSPNEVLDWGRYVRRTRKGQ
jgi:DNA-binding Xre family transcriptional regulator